MSWVNLTQYQYVSYNNLQDAVNTFQLVATGTSIPPTNQWIRKDQLATYVYLDTSNVYYAIATDRWLRRQAITPYTSYSFNITPGRGTASGQHAYKENYFPNTVYGTQANFQDNTIFYTNNMLSVRFNGSSYGYDADDGYGYPTFWTLKIGTTGIVEQSWNDPYYIYETAISTYSSCIPISYSGNAKYNASNSLNVGDFLIGNDGYVHEILTTGYSTFPSFPIDLLYGLAYGSCAAVP